MAINFSELPSDVQDKIAKPGTASYESKPVSSKISSFGRVLIDISSLSNREALWVLKRAIEFIERTRYTASNTADHKARRTRKKVKGG